MEIKELQHILQEAYTIKNLNKISLVLIDLYKTRQFTTLQKISEILSEYIAVNITDDGKGFSKLMMMYHPDRASHHIEEINRLTAQNNFDGLLEYSHILKLERIEEIANSLNNSQDIDYAPVYDWDMETEGFSIINDFQPDKTFKTRSKTELIGYTFYDAIKIREYGHTDIEYPSFYLEEIEEFELSASDINDLDGVQFCINARIIDLSDNRITDLSPLNELKNLEELNLSDNQIGYIDGLSNLSNLKSVILSNNQIDDISPLLELKKLEYADLTENKLDPRQINELIRSGVTVTW